MRVAIVGGGIMGVSLAYFLAEGGCRADVYEASPVLGGLAGPLTLPDGTEVDRFYHAILSRDAHLRELCERLGIAGSLRFRPASTGVYANGRMHRLDGIADFLRFGALGLRGRVGLGLAVARAQLARDWARLDDVPLEAWLRRVGGRQAYERFWQPMLAAKFDGQLGDVPATWMWSRLVRTRSTREGVAQREQCGHLVGGYRTLLEAMGQRVTAAGGRIALGARVSRVVTTDGRAHGVEVDGARLDYDAVVVTLQTPVAARLVPDAPAQWLDRLRAQRYLGIVCPLFVLDRPLTGLWTLNIADAGALLTGVIETTSYIDPALVGGHHLVYAPKYVAQSSPWLEASDEQIASAWWEALRQVGGARARDVRVRYCLVHRERFVEPLHGLGGGRRLVPVATPVASLFLATTSQIYPALTNGESVTRHAAQVARVVLDGRTS